MPSREEMLAYLKQQPEHQVSAQPSREEMLSFLKSKNVMPETAPQAEASPKTSAGQTALESYGNFMTGGYLPHFQAAVEPITDAIGSAITGKQVDRRDYLQSRDANIARQEQENSEHPIAHYAGVGAGIAASIAPAILSGGATLAGQTTTKIPLAEKIIQGAMAGAKTGAVYGAAANPGDTPGEYSGLQLGDRAKNAAIGSVVGGGIGVAAPLVGAGVKAAANKVGKGLQSTGESLALNATGATGKQISEFEEGAGRKLLDRGDVKAFDSQKNIANRLEAKLNEAHADIDSSLKELQNKGANVDANTIYNAVRNKIQELRKFSSQGAVADKLEAELENTIKATDARGTTKYPILDAEIEKRGYNKMARNWQDPQQGQAGKEMYQNWRGAVEGAAEKADPALAKKFTDAKETYGLLAPIQEAAERRSNVQNQHSAGGLLDLAAYGAGGWRAVLARKLIAPRLSSTLAVAADKAGAALSKTPEIPGVNPLATQQIVYQAGQKNPAIALPRAASIDQQKPATPAQAKPLKGEDKWASDGADKVQDHVEQDQNSDLDAELFSDKEAMLDNPKVKNLLVQASDLKPGSKAMAQIVSKIKSQLGKANA